MNAALRAVAVVFGLIGAYFMWVQGQNYAECHSVWIDGNQPACQAADLAHTIGVGLFILAAVFLALSFIPGPQKPPQYPQYPQYPQQPPYQWPYQPPYGGNH